MHGLIFVTWEKYLLERFGNALLNSYRAAIEAAVDKQMNHLRVRMIEQVAQANPLEQATAEARTSRCLHCGALMHARGKYARRGRDRPDLRLAYLFH